LVVVWFLPTDLPDHSPPFVVAQSPISVIVVTLHVVLDVIMRWLWQVLHFEKCFDQSWSLHHVDLTVTVIVKLDKKTLGVFLAVLLGVAVSLWLLTLGVVILISTVLLLVLLRVWGLVVRLWSVVLGVSTVHF
jgi:hypothetical protein